MMQPPVYSHTTELASGIPLGGLGTGSVELRADGRFHDWEIFNNYLWSGAKLDAPPEMWSEDAFFALRAKPAGEHPRVRLLYDDEKRSLAADSWYQHGMLYNYPFVRNVPRITYAGRHPFAFLRYEDPDLPLDVELEAFTPFIPLNAKDSGLPLAFFVFTLRNRGRKACDASLMFSMRNCVGYDQQSLTLRHAIRRGRDAVHVRMFASEMDPAARTYGSMAIAAMDAAATAMPAWTDGRGLTGFENAATPAYSQVFQGLRDSGALPARTGSWCRAIARQPEPRGNDLHQWRQLGWRWRSALCQQTRLKPGASHRMVFALAWHFPNHYHYSDHGVRLGHMYENWFADAGAVLNYGVRHYTRLHTQSRAFTDQLYSGSLPTWLADSLTAQLTTFPQSFWWTKDGDVAAWEGSACCQIIPNIHTIWSSFQPLLFFPELYLKVKRRMAAFARDEQNVSPFLNAELCRRNASKQAQRGALGGWFLQRYKQLGYNAEDFAPRTSSGTRTRALSLGSAVSLLRDYLWCDSRPLLDETWPFVRAALEHGFADDTNGDGLPDGAISFLTYDHWFPPATNCYRGTMWLAELAAGARLAELCGDTAFAERCRATLARGRDAFERLFWNGHYYRFCHDARADRDDEGCLADQVSGHLYLRLCGCAPVHNVARVRRALKAVHRYNRVPEHGLLNGADPHGRSDWRYFARYSARGDDEALGGQWVTPWTGTEYYVSAVMIAEGLVREGLDVARDVYERLVAMGMLYNHIECGEHYFRALAAWALLPALQGLVYDRPHAALTFAPKLDAAAFDTVFLLPGVWGRLRQERTGHLQRNCVQIFDGRLSLRRLTLSLATRMQSGCRVRVSRNDTHLRATADVTGADLQLAFSAPCRLQSGDTLTIEITRR